MRTINESEFDINLKNIEIEKIIVNTFNAISSILTNYNDYKIITNNIKSF